MDLHGLGCVNGAKGHDAEARTSTEGGGVGARVHARMAQVRESAAGDVTPSISGVQGQAFGAVGSSAAGCEREGSEGGVCVCLGMCVRACACRCGMCVSVGV